MKRAVLRVTSMGGDTAYSEKDNIHYAMEKELQLVSKLHPQITQGVRTEEKMNLNLHLAIRKARSGNKTKLKIKYLLLFEVIKCRFFP